MPQTVVQLTIEKIEKMKHYYHKSLLETPQGAIFRAKNSNAVITAYRSGKVLFQGKAPEVEAKKWHHEMGTTTSTTKVTSNKKHSYYPNKTLFTKNHIGSDEAGTGDYFGPITVACAYVKEDELQALKEIGIKDSKNLKDDKIVELSKEIVGLNIPYSLLILHNPKYNALQKRSWSQGKMKAMLHHHAITNLLKKIGDAPLDGILIDQFCEPTVYQKHIASEQQSLHKNTFFMTKAESYSIAVATASIIARASFVKEMDQLSEQVGFPLQKGASKKVDQQIATIINKHGENKLGDIAKLHFANTNKAKAYL